MNQNQHTVLVMNGATNCKTLPVTKYAYASNTFCCRCPETPAQAYRLGHGESAYWLSRKCEAQ